VYKVLEVLEKYLMIALRVGREEKKRVQSLVRRGSKEREEKRLGHHHITSL
jgi:hypothetical protein